MAAISRATFYAWMAARLVLTAFAQTPSAYQIEWDTNRNVVRVTGPLPVLRLESRDLPQLFPIVVEPADVLRAINLPATAGEYELASNSVIFRPIFPFEPGVTYRATFAPAKITSVLAMPARSAQRSTQVVQIYPTSPVLPQNLLKFYLHFSAPMSGGHIYEHIHLKDERGEPVELPFLEIDEELWNRDMTRLTLFLDPGRIKREVKPLEEVGPALLPERSYTLVISDSWRDARGVALKATFEKRFQVAAPDRSPPDPAQWKIHRPRQQTREPLRIAFDESLDHALALRLITLHSVTGRTELSQDEQLWTFTPDEPWRPGPYEIAVQSIIEDLAGNNPGKPFEVDLQSETPAREALRPILLRFAVD